MKIRFLHLAALFALAGAVCGVFVSAASADGTFDARRASMPAKLDALRTRTDAAGGKDLSLALLLGSRNKDARLVGSTVLVYQEYPKERKLAVLLAAAIRYNERLEVLQRVDDQALKNALSQAPAEMEGINGMFQTVDDLTALSAGQFQKAVNQARSAVRGLNYVRRAVPQALKAQGSQTSQADRD